MLECSSHGHLHAASMRIKRVYYAGSGDFKEIYNIKCRMRCELQATAHGIEEPLPRAITYFGSRKLLSVM
jgi:hypothetical protein